MRVLRLPPDPAELAGLVAGEEVLLVGAALTLRDAALKRLESTRAAAESPPFDLDGQMVFHAGPSPPAGGRPCGSIGPTTSARMDRFLPLLFAAGVKATLGKGPRSREAVELHGREGAVYLAAVGGAGALFGGMVESCEPVAWEDLGPEAVFQVVLKGMPAVVAIDASGNDFLSAQYSDYSGSGPVARGG